MLLLLLLGFHFLFFEYTIIPSMMRKMPADNKITSPPPTVSPTMSSTRLELSSLRIVPPTPGMMNGVATGPGVVRDSLVELCVESI